jgi:hypothetical protein
MDCIRVESSDGFVTNAGIHSLGEIRNRNSPERKSGFSGGYPKGILSGSSLSKVVIAGPNYTASLIIG